MSLVTLTDVESGLKLCMGFFQNDTTRFMIYLSRYLHKNPLRAKVKALIDTKVDQSNQEAKKKGEKEKNVTLMDALGDSSKYESMFKKGDDLASKISAAVEQGSFDLFAILKGCDEKSSTLEEAQRVRRASALGVIKSSITTGDMRRLSAVEKSTVVVESAIKLADTEEKEDLQVEEEYEQEDFAAEDEVVIIEGDNCGLFGTLQHSTTGIFAALDDTVKEDEDGYFGVDVKLYPGTENACTEGFWIHPEALQHKKYEANDEVYVTDGLNVGRYGNIQSDNHRLQFDEGCYGVDVKMDDGTVEGYWIHPTSMIPANESPERKKDAPEKAEETPADEEEDPELAEIDKFEFLPYIPFPADQMDEAIADLLNVQEIDINIKRLTSKGGKVVYRYGGQRHLVRYIHGVLLVKENGEWTELAPILQKLAGK